MCTLARGDVAVAGPASRHWSLAVLPGLEVPGWIGLILRRHAEGIEALNEGELNSLGPAFADVSHAIRTITGVDKVYLTSFGENFPHFHVLLAARGPEVPPEHRGPALQAHTATYRSVGRALEVASEVSAMVEKDGGFHRARGL